MIQKRKREREREGGQRKRDRETVKTVNRLGKLSFNVCTS